MKKENVKKVLLVVLAIIICIAVYVGVITVYKNSKKQPTNENQQQGEIITDENLYEGKDYPKIDGSTATLPLAEAFKANFTKTELKDVEVEHTKTHNAYVKLINDEVDLILVTEPSKEELELAKQKGVELEVIPVVKEGFVFYVNSGNAIDNLTTEQIQKIYTGEITNWKDVGGADEKILAYQRPTNSGSQTGMLSLVMKGLKMMEPKTETLAGTMEEIINFVSDYTNGKNAIGYSYYYYANTMFESIDKTVASNINLLGVDGVKPTNKTIQNGSYPFTTAYYIVINKADGEDSPARILANQMLSARGQKVAEEAGYVPVK